MVEALAERLSSADDDRIPPLRELTSQVSREFNWGDEQADRFMTALLSLAGYRDQLSVKPGTFARAVVAAFEPKSEDFEAKVASLLSTPSLEITARALALARESAQRYLGTRIVTDVRPVFEPNKPDEPIPRAAVILHTLKVETHDADGNFNTDFIALDETDLRELSMDIEFALKKGTAMRRMVLDAGVPLIELRDNDEDEDQEL